MKLECLATYQLFGNVMSLQAVSLAGSGRDALLMSFRDAKLSVVEYDLDSHNLKTLSLHYFEEEDMRVCILLPFACLPQLIVLSLTLPKCFFSRVGGCTISTYLWCVWTLKIAAR